MADSHGTKDALGEFLRKKKGEADTSGVDWTAQKEDWVSAVDRLYNVLTEDLLRKLIYDEHVVEAERVQTEITEEYVGTYSIPKLVLKVGNEKVELLPKGVNVIGAAGRVDLRGARDAVTLIRVRKNGASSDEWQVVLERVPRIVTKPLDSDSLNEALQRVML
jgi:hypothetical protein